MDSTRAIYVNDLYNHSFEDLDEYEPGGLHPTHLGDLLDGRYKVVHKLGQGGYGMVWLCRDTKENKWRAVKILDAEASTKDCADLRIGSLFSTSGNTDISHSRVAFALDHFWMDGPNGTHLCFVMPLLGPNLEDAAQRYRHEAAPLMRICYQMVQAMSFLHSNGVCHGDFRPQNVCFTLKDIDDLEEDAIIRIFGGPKLKCLVNDGEFEWDGGAPGEQFQFSDGEEGEGADSDNGGINDDASDHDADPQRHYPRYLVANAYIDPNSPYVSNDIAVIDFGESFLVSEPPEYTGIPQHYRSPEMFLDKCYALGFGSDLWALGCTISQVRVGCEPFFDIGDFWCLLRRWETFNGPLPEPYRSSLAEEFEISADLDQYVGTDLEEIEEGKKEYLRRTGVTCSLHNMLLIEHRFYVPLQEGEEPPATPPPTTSTRGYWDPKPGHKIVAVEMSRLEASQIMDLFRKIFAWKPSDRGSAAEILDLPCFAACRQEDEPASGSQVVGSEVASNADSVSSSGSEAPILQETEDDDGALVTQCGFPVLLRFFREMLRVYGI